MTASSVQLTKYRPGSVRELWALSWPMILSCAAGSLLLVGDRVVLSFYSQEAFNAHVGSTPWYWTLSVTVTNLIVVVQVFVGQFNGEKKFRDIGPAVWQMIWFSLSLWIVLIPVVRWCTPLLLTDSIGSTGTKYLQIAILFIPISCISSGALGAFFTGRGKTLLVSCVVIASNVLNIFLDVWLVFGGWGVPSLGMTGAAIASAIAQTAAFVVLFVMFYHPRNAVYGVFRARLNFSLMFRCLRLGLPNAVSGFMVLAGMSMALQIMATYVSAGEFTAFGIAHSFFFTCFFWFEGMGVGIETICSNAIGSRTFSTIDKNIWAAVKLLVIFGGVSFCTMIVAPDGLIRALLPKNSPADVLSLTRNILPWVWVVFLTEGTWFSIQSVLTAAGDTRFTMWVNVVVFWLVVVCPVCVGLAMRWCGAKFYWQMIVVEQCLCVFLMYRRYRSEVWKRHKI